MNEHFMNGVNRARAQKHKDDTQTKEAARILHDMGKEVRDFPDRHSRFIVDPRMTEVILRNDLDQMKYLIRIVAFPNEVRMFDTHENKDPLITAQIDVQDEMIVFWERLGEEAYKLNAIPEKKLSFPV